MSKFFREDIKEIKEDQSCDSLSSQSHLLKLNTNANPYPPTSLDQNICQYPENIQLKKRMSEVYNSNPKEILPTAGSAQAIDLIIRTFCMPNKDSILVCPPTYGMYEFYAKINHNNTYKINLKKNPIRLDLSEIIKFCRNKNIKLIFIPSPNSPIGSPMVHSDLLHLCTELKNKSIIVVDEAYTEFSKNQSLSEQISKFGNLIVTRTLSKAYGVSGLRVGAIISKENIIDTIHALQTPYSYVSTPCSNITLKQILTKEGIKFSAAKIKLIIRDREMIRQSISKFTFTKNVYESDTNFIFIELKCDPSLLVEFCKKHSVALKHIDSEPLKGVRLSIGTEKENDRLLDLFHQFETWIENSGNEIY